MGSHRITISDAAYVALKGRKRRNESFSDTILRIAFKRGDPGMILDYLLSEEFTPISDETAKRMEEASKEFRRNFKLRTVKL